MSLIPELKKWRQDDQKFKVILRFNGGLRPAWAQLDLISKQIKKQKTIKQNADMLYGT